MAELKLELKKRNLTVSGTKTTLLERYLHQTFLSAQGVYKEMSSIFADQ